MSNSRFCKGTSTVYSQLLGYLIPHMYICKLGICNKQLRVVEVGFETAVSTSMLGISSHHNLHPWPFQRPRDVKLCYSYPNLFTISYTKFRCVCIFIYHFYQGTALVEEDKLVVEPQIGTNSSAFN